MFIITFLWQKVGIGSLMFLFLNFRCPFAHGVWCENVSKYSTAMRPIESVHPWSVLCFVHKFVLDQFQLVNLCINVNVNKTAEDWHFCHDFPAPPPFFFFFFTLKGSGKCFELYFAVEKKKDSERISHYQGKWYQHKQHTHQLREIKFQFQLRLLDHGSNGKTKHSFLPSVTTVLSWTAEAAISSRAAIVGDRSFFTNKYFVTEVKVRRYFHFL